MADENTGAQGNENTGAQGNQNDSGNTGTPAVIDDATIERIAAASTRQAAQNHQQQGNQQQSQSNDAGSNDANSNNSGGSTGGIPEWAAALPETIARAVKEAVGTPQTVAQNNGAQGNENTGGQGKGNAGSDNGGPGGVGSNLTAQQKFAKWWGGR